MQPLLGLLFLVMLIASGWGSVRLAIRWASHWLARVALSIALFVVFTIAGSAALIAGCIATSGPLNFQ